MIKNIRAYYFLTSITGGFFATGMPLYYDGLNFNGVQIGILIGLPSTAMLVQPIWGFIVDKYQNHKQVAMLGMLLSGIILMFLMTVQNFIGVAIIIALYSFFKVPIWSIVDNIVITYCINKNKNYGTLRVFASIAWGSSLLIMYPIIMAFGFNTYLVVNLIISVACAFIISLIPANTELDSPKEQSANLSFSESLSLLLQDKNFYLLLGFTLFFSATFVTNLNYQAMYFDELNKGELFIAIAMFVSIVPEFVIMPNIDKIEKRFNDISLLMFVTVIVGFKFFTMALVHNIVLLLFLVSIHGIAMAIYIPTFVKMFKLSVPNKVSTIALTINGLMAAISGIIMSLIAGIVHETTTIENVFFLNCISLCLAFLMLIIYKREVNKER